MQCDFCGGNTVVKRVELFHYTECGLPNVYLSGVNVEECATCGAQSPRLPRILELHAALAEAVALKPSPLTGAEARFLRQELGLKAKEWAAYLHVDTATLSRWEKGDQTIGTQSDVFLRTSYFLLRASQTGAPLRDDLRERLTAIAMEREEGQMLVVNPAKPARVTYRLASEVAFA